MNRFQLPSPDEELDALEQPPTGKPLQTLATLNWLLHVGLFRTRLARIRCTTGSEEPVRVTRAYLVDRWMQAHRRLFAVATASLPVLLVAAGMFWLAADRTWGNGLKAKHAYMDGDYTMAARHAVRQLAITPEDDPAWFTLGMSLYWMGEDADAWEVLNRFDGNAWSDRGIDARFTKAKLLYAQGRFEASLDLLQQNERLPAMMKNLWRVRNLLVLGAVEDARPLLEQIRQQYPPPADVHLLYGQCLEMQGDDAGAEAAWKESRSKGLFLVKPLEQLVQLYARLGRDEECVRTAESILPFRPVEPETLVSACNALERLGRRETAEAWRKTARLRGVP